jgi:hypothetical protein
MAGGGLYSYDELAGVVFIILDPSIIDNINKLTLYDILLKFVHTTFNKNVDIKFNAHDAFLEQPSSGNVQNRKIGKPNNLKFWG